MSTRIITDKVKNLLDKDYEQTGRPLLRIAIGKIFDDVDTGMSLAEAMYKHHKLLRISLYKIEDIIYEITGERIKAKGAGYPKFKRRYRKRIVDKEAGEIKIAASHPLPQNAIPEQLLPVDIKTIEQVSAQVILTFDEMMNIYKLFQANGLQDKVTDSYIIICAEPKKFGIKFLDEKNNIRMEILNERKHSDLNI